MTTKNIQDVYLNIVAAFGTTPLDESEVKSILTQLMKEVEAGQRERIEKVSEFDARLAIEPSRDFLEGAVAMKKLILDNLTSDVTEQ